MNNDFVRNITKFNQTFNLDFSSNDYLCFANNEHLIEKAYNNIIKIGIGAKSSRLICQSQIHDEIEEYISSIKKKDRTIIFPSGYQMNSSAIVTIINMLQEIHGNVEIFIDKLNHASIYSALFQTGLTIIRYNHQNLDMLELQLQKSINFKIIITETIFSMDGTITDMKKLIYLKEKYNAFLYIDDAHSFGIYGQNMLGITEGFEQNIDIIAGTFSKAIGCQGAYLSANNDIVNYIINKCHGFIYSTAISPFLISFALEAMKFLPQLTNQINHLLDLSHFTRQLFSNKFNIISQSHIIPIIDNVNNLEKYNHNMQNKLIKSYIIKHPTVNKNHERIRLSLNISHTKDDIYQLYECFQ